MRFNNKVVLVTGSSSGIGRATAIAFAKEGASVVINCNEREDDLGAVQREIEALDRPCLAQVADVSVREQVDSMVASALARFGRVDILVNNAGITSDRTTLKMMEEQWRRVLDVNLSGAWQCVSAVAPHMIKQGGGVIVSVSSVVAHMGNFGQANYAASKAGLIGMTKSMALEFATKGIRINVVAPGFIATPMVEAMPTDVLDAIRARVPMRRLGTTEEIAEAILYLASDAASFITGETLNVNGGLYLH